MEWKKKVLESWMAIVSYSLFCLGFTPEGCVVSCNTVKMFTLPSMEFLVI